MAFENDEFSKLETIRVGARNKFDLVQKIWLEAGLWTLPYRTTYLISRNIEKQPTSRHITDTTHLESLNIFVSGFLQGNTPSSRDWAKIRTGDLDTDSKPENYNFLTKFTKGVHRALSRSNFYNAVSQVYGDLAVFNSALLYIEEKRDGLHFYCLEPGSYYVVNDDRGRASVLIREYALTVKALVDTFGQHTASGQADWSKFSPNVKHLYDRGHYTYPVGLSNIVKQNENYDYGGPVADFNQPWETITYEIGTGSQGSATGSASGTYFTGFGATGLGANSNRRVIHRGGLSRKPFVLARGHSTSNFEYGQKGPTTDSLGTIKSLNTKSRSRDNAIHQMLQPAFQGPKGLTNETISSAANRYIGIDNFSLSQGQGLTRVNEIHPGISTLLHDVEDLRQQVRKLYYSDYLVHLLDVQKTRTATETQAVVNEQRIVIGPVLQSMNWTLNDPTMDYVMDYVLFNDPTVGQPPQGLVGSYLKPEYVSLFAQSQHASDLPSIREWLGLIATTAELKPTVLDTMDEDKLSLLFQDRLFIPDGIRRDDSQIAQIRQGRDAQEAQLRQQEQALEVLKIKAQQGSLQGGNPLVA